MIERLQKILSRYGIASRREAEQIILSGRVYVNGNKITELGTKADPDRDRIEINGKLLQTSAPEFIYLLLNKPTGVVCTCDDPGRNHDDEASNKYGRLDQPLLFFFPHNK